MATVLFLTEQYLMETSVINDNADIELLKPVIKECQDIYIHSILGTGLYNELQTQITASTLTALNTTLLDTYIQPALRYWVQFESAPILTYKFMNKSIVKKNSENSTPVELNELKFLMDKFKDKAEWYSQRLTEYLCANQVSYPLFNNPGSTSDTIHPQGSQYSAGMYLGDDIDLDKVDPAIKYEYQRLFKG